MGYVLNAGESWTERKKESRNPQLCTKRRAISGNNSNLKNKLQKKQEKPEIQIQLSKLDKISEAPWDMTYIGIMLLRERNSLFRRRFSETSELF